MTLFLLAVVVAGGVAGDLLKAYAMRRQGAPRSFQRRALGRYAVSVLRTSWFAFALAAYTVSFFGFMALLSVQDVSFAVPATALGYALETMLAAFVLRERVSVRRWTGAALVTAGVCLIV